VAIRPPQDGWSPEFTSDSSEYRGCAQPRLLLDITNGTRRNNPCCAEFAPRGRRHFYSTREEKALRAIPGESGSLSALQVTGDLSHPPKVQQCRVRETLMS